MSGNVSYGNWNRDSTQANLDRNDPRTENAKNGARSAVMD